jgi:hypothetical protein
VLQHTRIDYFCDGCGAQLEEKESCNCGHLMVNVYPVYSIPKDVYYELCEKSARKLADEIEFEVLSTPDFYKKVKLIANFDLQKVVAGHDFRDCCIIPLTRWQKFKRAIVRLWRNVTH